MKKILFTALLAWVMPVGAKADVACPIVGQPYNKPCYSQYKMPDTMSFGAGYFDFTKNNPRLEAADFRFEYRWGYSILSSLLPSYKSWDAWFQLHPYAGIETSSRGQLYGFTGLLFDFTLGRHLVLTPSFAVGLYERGYGKRLGSVVEFRSIFEAGWRFDNNVRLTAFISHMSNAHLTDYNPGANTIGGYVHIPVRLF